VLERLLAGLLHHGSRLACAVIAAGLALALIGPAAAPETASRAIIEAGIAILILLPALRVLVMAIVFLAERDYRFGAIAALVLAIILLGAVLGAEMAGAMPG
jgi:hypothetical protein